MVKKKGLPVKWDIEAKEDLDAIYNYIYEESSQAAKKVKKELVKLAGSLKDYPERYSVEPLLEELIGNYRSAIKWDYKIIYEVTESEVIILCIFHVAQNPEKLKQRFD